MYYVLGVIYLAIEKLLRFLTIRIAGIGFHVGMFFCFLSPKFNEKFHKDRLDTIVADSADKRPLFEVIRKAREVVEQIAVVKQTMLKEPATPTDTYHEFFFVIAHAKNDLCVKITYSSDDNIVTVDTRKLQGSCDDVDVLSHVSEIISRGLLTELSGCGDVNRVALRAGVIVVAELKGEQK